MCCHNGFVKCLSNLNIILLGIGIQHSYKFKPTFFALYAHIVTESVKMFAFTVNQKGKQINSSTLECPFLLCCLTNNGIKLHFLILYIIVNFYCWNLCGLFIGDIHIFVFYLMYIYMN